MLMADGKKEEGMRDVAQPVPGGGDKTYKHLGKSMILGVAGACWGAAGEVLGPLGDVLAASWGLSGAFWVVLGASWKRPGAFWRSLGASWSVLERSGDESCDPYNSVLGSEAGNPVFYEGLWRPLEASWRRLGASWERLGAS